MGYRNECLKVEEDVQDYKFKNFLKGYRVGLKVQNLVLKIVENYLKGEVQVYGSK